jgi:hypothetical protein
VRACDIRIHSGQLLPFINLDVYRTSRLLLLWARRRKSDGKTADACVREAEHGGLGEVQVSIDTRNKSTPATTDTCRQQEKSAHCGKRLRGSQPHRMSSLSAPPPPDFANFRSPASDAVGDGARESGGMCQRCLSTALGPTFVRMTRAMLFVRPPHTPGTSGGGGGCRWAAAYRATVSSRHDGGSRSGPPWLTGRLKCSSCALAFFVTNC